MSRVTIDLRQPEGELPPLDFTLSDTDLAIARFAREAIAAQQIQQNEKEQTKQG